MTVCGSPWVVGIAAFVVSVAAVTASATEFTLAPNQTVLGTVQSYTTKTGDVLPALQRPHDIGYA